MPRFAIGWETVLTALLALATAATPSADCPALFGDDAARARAGARVARLVVRLEEEGGALHLVHRGPFTDARPARLDGLVLSRVEEGAAEVELVEPSAGCAPGTYRLEAGDRLGGGTVLAVAGGAVLLADGERLLVLAPDGVRTPRVRLTWASPWKLYERRTVAAGAGSKSHPKPKASKRRKR
jgi:hypothetical protein